MGTLELKWGPNGDPKTEKGPHGDRVPQMGTHVGTVLEQGGKRWCFSKEVANLLPHWGGKDLVNRMLKVKTEEQDGGEVDQEAIVAPN